MKAMGGAKDRPKPRGGILKILRYRGGEAPDSSIPGAVKMSSNESPFGASAKARAAYLKAADNLSLYPDGDATALRQTIAARHGIEAARIVCGAGSDEIIHLLAQIYLEAGDEAIHMRHGFAIYRIAILAAGGRPVIAEEETLMARADRILEKVSERTKIVFLANPNNPTSSCMGEEEIRRLHAALPEKTLLVIDAAYAEYADRADDISAMSLVGESENVVMTRTFSKIYGLAALRLGWAYAPAEVAEMLNRTRAPFNVSGAALAAGRAAYEDVRFTESVRRHAIGWRAAMRERAIALGLDAPLSETNFILMRFPRGEDQASRAYRFLAARGFQLRPMGIYALPDALRASAALDEATERFARTLEEFMSREGGGG